VIHRVSRLVHRVQSLWWAVARPVTVGVRVIAVEQDQVMLVRHRYLDGWYLPGGGVRPGETHEQAVRREAFEELGVTLGALTLFGIYTNVAEGKRDHIVVFSSGVIAREAHRSWEIAQAGQFSLDRPPPGTSPGTLRRLAEYPSATAPVFGGW
jgi:ADP-ribose pyrophosphatase YjhB (NUDIX family)